jgi:hypothetical protein
MHYGSQGTTALPFGLGYSSQSFESIQGTHKKDMHHSTYGLEKRIIAD